MPPSRLAMRQVVFGHAVAGHRESGEHADRVEGNQRVDRAAGHHQQRHRQRGERDDPVRKHQAVTAFRQLPWQETVFGDEAGQGREAVEAGVRAGEQDGRRRGLDQDVEHVTDHAVAVDGTTDLRQDRWIFGQIRGGVGDVGQVGDPGEQEAQYAGHRREHPTGVAALGLSEVVDRVGDGLDAGQRRTPLANARNNTRIVAPSTNPLP